MGTTATRLKSVISPGGEVEPMADESADPATLEERVLALEAHVAALEQKFNYLQTRNHSLESAVAASAALLASVTVPTMAFGSGESQEG